jgi:hypothetical protein
LGGIVEHLDTTKFDYWKAQGAGIGNRETWETRAEIFFY